MGEAQPEGMQGLSFDERLTAAIQVITEEGMTCMGQVYADLMGSTSFQRELDE